MHDEKIVPKANLAVGAGPVLTTEVGERTCLLQLRQPRSIEFGPRFHKLIGGMHVERQDAGRLRFPDGPFHVFLVRKADDPAEEVGDVIYATQKIAVL